MMTLSYVYNYLHDFEPILELGPNNFYETVLKVNICLLTICLFTLGVI